MVNKYLNVTKSVTKDYLNQISTKGYDFFWDVATDGYEWSGKDRLVFDKDLNRSLYFHLHSADVPMFPRKFHYDQNKLLYGAALSHNVTSVQEAHPEGMDRDSPWLVEKGSLELCQKQNIEKTPGYAWKSVPTRQYKPLSDAALHRRFASLKTENLETEVLRFANKYGFLGRTVPLATRRRQTPAVVIGESIYRWHTEIDRMGVLLALWDLISQQKDGKLGQIIIWRSEDSVDLRLKWQSQNGQYKISRWEGQEKEDGFGHIFETVESRHFSTDFFSEYRMGQVIGPAWYYLGSKLNHFLYGIRPKLVGFHEHEVTFIPRTLLDSLWLLFMLEVNGKIRTGRCKYCSEWFDLERSDKMYCNGNCRRLAFYHKQKSKAKGGKP